VFLTLALLAVTASTPKLPSQSELVDLFDGADAAITEVIDHLPTRMGVQADQPHLGFTMRTEEVGLTPDGLPQRHTFIASVFRDSPAFKADIRPGDRIVSIGAITCDTLKPKAVLFYLSDFPKDVPLTLERNAKSFTVTVRRAPLPCAAATWKAFPETVWRDRMTRLRALVNAARAEVAAAPPTPEQTAMAMKNLRDTAVVIQLSLEKMSEQLNPALADRCVLVR
jgi:hypothetical protein